MGRHLRRLDPDRSPADWFGVVLREWRMKRGLSQQSLADRVFQSRSLISFIEAAQRRPSLDLVLNLDRVLDAGGAIESAWRHATAPVVEAAGGGDERVGLAWTRTGGEAVEWTLSD